MATITAPLTNRELSTARDYFTQTRAAVLGALQGLTATQWTHKPAPDRWSILENLAHVVAVQDFVLHALTQLPSAPPPPRTQDPQLVDDIVIHRFPNRLARFKSPEPVHPAPAATPSSTLARFEDNHARLAAALETTPGLRQHALPAPPLRAVTNGAMELMDGYQWILATASHAERHVKQILEVRAHAAFPNH